MLTENDKKRRAELLAMPMNTPLTVEEAALVMACGPRTVYRLIAAGEMKSARVSGGSRILKQWVFEYLHREWDERQSEAAFNPAHS